LLKISRIVAGYGAITALKGVSIEVRQGEIVAILGANGAGKSTLLRAISGLLKPREGTIHFGATALHTLKAYEISRLGVTHCPEGRRIFANMSVHDNLEIGAYGRNDAAGVLDDLMYVRSLFPALAERSRQRAGTLSGGEQQMLALGRSLMSRPKLLLLDEPSLGLAPRLIDAIFETIARIRDRGVTIILVEQNATMALEVAERGYVLETGSVALEGTAAELLANSSVAEAYLGGGPRIPGSRS
jgi:branched-chain amino acid transport system ATP-binding protein